MNDQGLATTLQDIPEIPEGSHYASAVVDARSQHTGRDAVLERVRRKLTFKLGQEPAVVALFDREQAEWLLGAAQPRMGPDDRMMIAVALPS